jgi:chromosome segregation ATPase
MPEDKFQKLSTDVELLKKDIHQMSGLFDRLDTTIEKLSEVSSNIGKILAVHESKIDRQDQISKEILHMLEIRRKEIDADQEQLERDVREEIKESHAILLREIKDLHQAQVKHHEEVSKRLTVIERWRFLIIGGAAVVGWIISQLPRFLN